MGVISSLALINLLFTPLYEELVFRYAMRHLFPGDYAWLIISLVFALCHVPNYLVAPHPNVLVHQIFLLLFGIQLWQYSLRDSILIHYTWNICMGLLRYGLTRWCRHPVATVDSSITTFIPKKHCILQTKTEYGRSSAFWRNHNYRRASMVSNYGTEVDVIDG